MPKIAHINTTSLLRVSVMACVASVVWGSSAFAEGSSLPYGGGGPFARVDPVISNYNQSGELFRIEGSCRSSCTTLLSIRSVCVEPSATLLFHAAILRPGNTPTPEHTAHMLGAYNARLREFVVSHHYMDSWEFHAISGSDIIHKFGYRACPRK
jgi:hypothetical protein